MKNLFVLFFSLLNVIPVFTYNQMGPVERHTETIKKELSFKSSGDNIFMIENVIGNIELEGYNGSTIQVEIEKVIEANNNKKLQEGIKDIQSGTYQNDQGVILFMDAPFVTFDKFSKDFLYNGGDKMALKQFCNKYEKDDAYKYEMNYKVKLPRNVNVRLDNMSGNIFVKGVNGDMLKIDATSGHVNLEKLNFDNVAIKNMSGHIIGAQLQSEDFFANSMSGHVKLYNLQANAVDATTMSGHVIVTYDKNPSADSKFTSMSGHVDVTFQPGLSADINSQVGANGMCKSVYESKASGKISKKMNSRNNKNKGNCSNTCTNNKSAQSSSYKVGNGGPALYFSSMNGHVKLKEAGNTSIF